MTTAAARGVRAIVTVGVLLGLGAGAGVAVGDVLGIRTEPAAQMTPADPVVPLVAESVPPPTLTGIDAPEGLRMATAVDELLAAVAAAPSREGEATLAVVVGDGADDDDTYRLEGDLTALRIEGASLTGAVRGIYDLAAAVRAGRPIDERLGQSVTSRLPFRMVDLGAVGVTPDPAEWAAGTDYSHVSRAFENAYLADAPYIDDDALSADFDDWMTFLQHSVSLGYNAVAWPGFLEYVTLESAPGGGVYPEGDPHIARADALREAFTPFWDYAAELGVKVYLRTDMLSLTPALESYLIDRFGTLDTANPALWDVYTQALDELYQASPALSGILLRIGEGGSIYALPSWDYYSALAVRDVASVQAMLTAFTDHAEATDREVIFRTWSVGIGDVGDMHTDADSYAQVLAGVDSPALIVSTKYTLGDFYSWLPLNDTLEVGDQRRIVELQSRREFEAFGSFPNDLGPEYQWALQQLLAANPHIEGIWTWTQDGGPWRAGPMTLYLKAGFWHLYELNTVVAGALARDPEADVGQVTADWARRWFSDDPATITAITTAMAASREAVTQGLYLPPFAEQRVRALGLEPPPQMWLFEWDILTGDSATLDLIATIVGDDLEAEITRGAEAVAAVEGMRETLAATDPASWRSPELREDFLATLDYEQSTLGLLAAYREMFLRQAQWHDGGSPVAHDAWQQARDRYESLAAEHLRRYQGDVDHPAWNLTAAQLGVDRADRDLPMAWLARVLLVLVLGWLLIGALATRGRLTGRGSAAARATWIASTRPWRAQETTAALTARDRTLLALVPGALLVVTRAVQTSFLAPVQLALTLGAWAVFVMVVLVLLRGRSPWAVVAAVAGVAMLRCVVVLTALSLTGPGGYWFAFFTDPTARVLYIAIASALFLWAFVAAGWAASTALGVQRATGAVLTAIGAGLALPAVVTAAVGLERVLTVWNDQMGLLPWGLARILGITTYLEIPESAAWYAAAVGAALLVVGLALTARTPPRTHFPTEDTPQTV